jgi:hypothetical protein
VNWRELNDVLNGLDEQKILTLLNEERVTRRRVTVMTRLHQRYTILRAARERRELLNDAVKP